MTALFKFALTVLLLIWPAAVNSPHYPGPKVDAFAMTLDTPDAKVNAYCFTPDERRVCRIAREVAEVVDEHASHDRVPFAGPMAKQATVLALLEIAWHESGFRSKVEDCRITGDLPTRHSKITEGLAVSLFQLQANSREDLFEVSGVFAGTKKPRPKRWSREAVCKSNRLAVRLARHALMRQAWVSRSSFRPLTVNGMFFAYAGNGGRSSRAGREHVEQFEVMLRQHKLAIVPAKGAMWAESN